MLNIPEDIKKDGLISQIVRRVTSIEEYIRNHKALQHSTVDNTYPNAKILLKKSATLPAIVAGAPGTTTIFDVAVPANFLTGDNGIRWQVRAVIDTNANARTATWVLYYDDTVVATTGAEATAGNKVFEYNNTGALITTGVNTQRGFIDRHLWDTSSATLFYFAIYKGTGAEDVSTAKNIKLTLAISGSVDSAVLYDAVVELLEAP